MATRHSAPHSRSGSPAPRHQSADGEPERELATNGSGQGIIGREQLAVQLLGQRDVCSIVGREVRPELENPTEQRLMAVPKDGQIQIIVEGIGGTYGAEPSREETPPKGRGDLDVTERRCVKVRLRRLQDAFNLARALCLQEVFDKS
jgi:hypothetical protein